MNDREAALRTCLLHLREEYQEVGDRALELFRMLGEDTGAMRERRRRVMEESDIDALPTTGFGNFERVLESAVRALMARHLEAVREACSVLQGHGLEADVPERIYAEGLRAAGIDRILDAD